MAGTLFLVLVDEVCTCLGNGLFSIFFRFGYRKLHPFGRINLIITIELKFHTQTAGLYLGWHLIQREIFPVCFSQPISLLEAASTYYVDFETNADRCNPASDLTLDNATYAMPALKTKDFVEQIDNSTV